MKENDPASEKKDAAADLSAMLGMGGFLDGVTNLISKFGELAERGETLRHSTGETASGKPYQSSAGFSIKFGPGTETSNSEASGSDSMRVAPVNNRTTRPTTKRTASGAGNNSEHVPKGEPAVREPHVDLYEEADHTLLLAEMPGVATEDLKLRFEDRNLHLEGTSKTALFRAQIELPIAYQQHQVSVTANNGVIEIRLNNN